MHIVGRKQYSMPIIPCSQLYYGVLRHEGHVL